jgi:mannose-6-phosphate isomerase
MSAQLPSKFVEKPWGCDRIDSRFRAPPGRIGEIWLESPAELASLLAKYLFTSEPLSVQVHPTEEQARALDLGSTGKDECWLVIDAQPGAKLGIGFSRSLHQDELRAACDDGEIANLLVWHDVRPGDFFYLPANTVHAIGPGLVLLEVQQKSELTFRLYDFGRSRELHVDCGLAIARAEPYPDDLHQHLPVRGEICLVEGPHFRLDRVDGPPSISVLKRYGGRAILALPLTGEIVIGNDRIGPGSCGATSDLDQIRFSPEGLCLLAQPLKA